MTAGETVTETFAFDGGRQVTAYLPPSPAGAVVFSGDGPRISEWGTSLEATGAPPTAIISVHRGADETRRLHEYSPGFDPTLFAAHERFFVEEVGAWARARFGLPSDPRRTAVYGASAGGELALALGLRHPEAFGTVLCASPGGGYRPPTTMPSLLPRAYFVAGTLEPFFLRNATRWADRWRAAGAEVVLAERAGSHGDLLWRGEFPRMIAWAFGGRLDPTFRSDLSRDSA